MLSYLEKRSEIFWVVVGLVLVSGVGMIDVLTGPELSFSLFYLIPIATVTWFAGKKSGLVISIISAFIWFEVDWLTGQPYIHPAIRYWNAMIRLGFFIIVSWLLPAIRELGRERWLARLDYLTGAANRRFVFEIVQNEIERSQRYGHPFGIAYLDLDGFKNMNDQHGHKVGDAILCAVVNRAQKRLRKTDTIARIGGDEFIIVFPETDRDKLQKSIPRIQSALLDEMKRNHWPVTFSIGAISFHQPVITADDCIKLADKLMYTVKQNGKNAIAYEDHAG
jgi:diguanylate cyclase (GGDEF)-like protein